MVVTYRDNIGTISVLVDEHGISFINGDMFFSDGEKEYCVESTDVISIQYY